MKLTNAQRSKLMDVPKSHDWSIPNQKLEIAIAEIRNENPDAFWTPETLILRRFVDEPKLPIPNRGWLRSRS
jgi:hypothetical protein